MTAIEMIIRRTDISEDDAGYYSTLAEMRVRMFLNLDESADLTPYTLGIAEIAILIYRSDKAAQEAEASAAYSSVSMSEGSVSKSVATISHAELAASYEKAIQEQLNNLSGQGGKVVFL